MTALAKGIYTLAFIALSMMQPTGQWFCTVTKSVCAISSVDCCSTQQPDCDGEAADQPKEGPCCVEIDGEWQAVPSTKADDLPGPAVVDSFLPGPADIFAAPGHGDRERFVFTNADPPPLRSASLEFYCVRLI